MRIQPLNNTRLLTACHTLGKTCVIGLCALGLLTAVGCSRLKEKQEQLELDKSSVEQLYQDAKNSLNDKEWEEAIDKYQSLRARYPYGQYSEQSEVELGYAQFKRGDTALATATLERFLDAHPTHKLADYAYYLRGLAAYNEDSSFIGRVSGRQDLSDRDPAAAERAIESFETLITRFPDSRYATDASRRVLYIASALAQHEMHVARYYLKREAYIAVVNRAKSIIEDYERTPVVEDALGIMATAYIELGMTDLAEDTLRVLTLNFPESPHLQTVRESRPAEAFEPVARANNASTAEKKPGFFQRWRDKRKGTNNS